MAAYINVDDLEKCFEEFSFYYLHNYEDLVPVIHAHWVDYRGNYVPVDKRGYTDNECICSACGDYLTASDEYYVRAFYCPNCGAKMDEEV